MERDRRRGVRPVLQHLLYRTEAQRLFGADHTKFHLLEVSIDFENIDMDVAA